MPQPTPHTPGQPATGWSTGFIWDHPENAGEKARMAGELNFMSLVTTLARDMVKAFDSLDTILGGVAANHYELRTNLPPFPLPGTLAPLRLDDVGVGLPLAGALLGWATTSQKFPVYIEGQADPVEVEVRPIDVLRRVAKAGG